MQNINNKGNSTWREKGCVWEVSVLSAHVFCKPKMALQNKITNLNRIKREEKMSLRKVLNPALLLLTVTSGRLSSWSEPQCHCV